MAGVVPTRRSTSGRKQWPSHDGPNSSLKQLRSQFATEGCPESQVVLAKQLLNETCYHEGDRLENAKLGVYWLIKASEQGNEEATSLLKSCYDNGKGITEQNYLDVKSCISMTQDEKLARKAAKEMFASLSNGEDYITSYQLQRKILELDKEKSSDKKDITCHEQEPSTSNGNSELINHFDAQMSEDFDEEMNYTQRPETQNEKLTEDQIVSAAINYTHGHLPLVNNILCLQEPNLHALDHIPYIQRSILHPVLLLKILYYKIIRYFSKKFTGYLQIVKTDIQWLSLLLLYTFISSENTIYFIPVVIYYISFVVMILTTFQTLQTSREYSEFKLWSGLFICYSGGDLNPEQAEYQYIKNNLKPYGHYFLALLVNLMMYPVINEQNLPHSELSIVSFFLTFSTLVGYMQKRRSKIIPDFLILLSFSINVLAKYPYETDPVVTQGWRFLDLKIPHFASYIIGNGIEFCINFRILLYAFIPVLFMQIARREKWRGTYKYLIPHCITLSWLQIVIINSQGATMFGLIRGTLALVGVVLFLPLVGLTSVIIPSVALTKWLITPNLIYNITIFAAILLICFTTCFLLAKTRFKKFSAVLQLLAGVISCYLLIMVLLKDSGNVFPRVYEEKAVIKKISWPQYQKLCYEPQWVTNKPLVHTQVLCEHLEGIPIHWDGYIKDIRLTNTRNLRKNVIDRFPEMLQDTLYCYYGDVSYDCNNNHNLALEDCNILKDVAVSKRRCSLDKFNEYEYQIVLRMQNGLWDKGSDIHLQAAHVFTNFTLALRAEDNIYFKGYLSKSKLAYGTNNNNKPALIVQVILTEIGCINCADSELTSDRAPSDDITYKKFLNDLYSGGKCVLNFLFNPIVVFK